jgi:predicted nucleic acid-binding protein
MIDRVQLSNRYVIDTNIIIYTLKGIQEGVQTLEQLEDDDLEVYYSTIVEAELFSFHELTIEQKKKN